MGERERESGKKQLNSRRVQGTDGLKRGAEAIGSTFEQLILSHASGRGKLKN